MYWREIFIYSLETQNYIKFVNIKSSHLNNKTWTGSGNEVVNHPLFSQHVFLQMSPINMTPETQVKAIMEGNFSTNQFMGSSDNRGKWPFSDLTAR